MFRNYLINRARGFLRNATSQLVDAVCLVLDRSQSMANMVNSDMSRLDAAQDASQAFVSTLSRGSPGARVGVTSFSNTGIAHCCLMSVSRDQRFVNSAIDSIELASSTNMRAGLAVAEEVLFASVLDIPFSSTQTSKRIVFLSDGHNTGRDPIPAAVRLKKMGVSIHTVGVASSPQEVDGELLKAIASVVNGKPQYRFIEDNAEQLTQHFRQLANRLCVRT